MVLDRRLLVVTESLGTGGTESHLRRLLPRLSASGWNVKVFCVTARGVHADELESNGIEVRSAHGVAPVNKHSHRHPMLMVSATSKLFSLLRRWRPAIAHFYLPGPYVMGAPLAIANRTPVKIMSRRSLSIYQQKWPMVSGFERKLHKSMDALVGNSRAVVAELLNESALEHKIRLIYNGIEPSELQVDRGQARRQLGLDERVLVGVMVANLIPYKGHHDLIRGLVQIAERLPVPWRVLLVGRDEGRHAKLEKLAHIGGIVGNIQFLGERSDVTSILAAADFGLLTSHQEGFSNVILEGMGVGLPMIVANIGGNPEAVLHERTGIIVPPHDPTAIGEAVMRLAHNPELRARFGAAGKSRIVNEFTLDRCVQAHNELYEELLTRSPARKKIGRANFPKVSADKQTSTRPLMLAYWGRRGALPQLTLELAASCQEAGRGTETTVSVSTSNELFDKYCAFGEAIFPVQTYSSAFSVANVRALARLRKAVKQRLRQDGTRAFVTLMPHVWSPIISPILRKAGIRHTVIVHDADAHPGDRTAFVNAWLLREAKSADRVVTLTSAVAQRLLQKKLVPEEKISILFHPDLTYTSAETSDRSTVRIAFLGRILPYKGLSQFVGAMEILRQEGAVIKTGVFGEGNLNVEWRRLKTLGAEVFNYWLEQKQIAAILNGYDLVVVAHTEASQSGVVAAAHGAGLPVVVTPVGGLKEQVRHEFDGLVAEGTTAEAIANSVRSIVQDRKLLNRLRKNIAASRQERSMVRFFLELSKIALD